MTCRDDTIVMDVDMHHRFSLSDICARTGLYIVAGPKAIGDVKFLQGETPLATVSGIGLIRHLNDETVQISEPRVRKT